MTKSVRDSIHGSGGWGGVYQCGAECSCRCTKIRRSNTEKLQSRSRTSIKLFPFALDYVE